MMAAGRFFNHDISRWVPDSFSGRVLYSSRVLGITEPEDTIQLPLELRGQWKAITSHYARTGLSHSHRPVWDLSFETLTQNQDMDLSVFLFDDVNSSDSLAAKWYKALDPGWFESVRFINSKNNFIALAEQLGIAVPATVSVDCRSLIDLSSLSYPCYLKPAVSGNGAGIVRCSSPKKLKKALSGVPDKIPLQVQEEIKADCFINLQYTASENRFSRLAATEQILDGNVYIGSSHPVEFQPWELMDTLAKWLTDRGMKGIFAFDLAVIRSEDTPGYLALECNPRYNGASYPSLAAGKLGIESWSFETFSTGFRSLEDINLKRLEFNPATGKGLILITWGTILAGKLGILLAGPKEEQDRMRIQLQKIL